jgi:hypothetical protein
LLYKIASVERYLDIRHQIAARPCSKMRGCLRLYIVASVAEIFRAPGSRRHTSQAQK